MRITHDIDLTVEDEREITTLLQGVFKEYEFPNRSYYKLRPHFRCLYEKDNQLVAYAGLDYRVMKIDGKEQRVLGIIDLAVDERYRRNGIATEILTKVERFAKGKQVDVMLLFADNPALYTKNGFVQQSVHCTLLMIHEHTTLGTKTALYDEVMIKQLHPGLYEITNMDMLGYLY